MCDRLSRALNLLQLEGACGRQTHMQSCLFASPPSCLPPGGPSRTTTPLHLCTHGTSCLGSALVSHQGVLPLQLRSHPWASNCRTLVKPISLNSGGHVLLGENLPSCHSSFGRWPLSLYFPVLSYLQLNTRKLHAQGPWPRGVWLLNKFVLHSHDQGHGHLGTVAAKQARASQRADSNALWDASVPGRGCSTGSQGRESVSLQ